MSLYFHIPFCEKKCDYCNFFVLPNKAEYHSVLLEALSLEWEQKLPQLLHAPLCSIYFGGGTPSLFGAKAINEILSWIQRDCTLKSDCEITLEINPEDVSAEKIQAFKEAGINRMSMGVQSLNDQLLLSLGRQHSSQKALDAIHCIKDNGINNLSIDLMYELPRQEKTSWLEEVERISRLPIEHLSLYNLTIEKGTVFYKKREEIQKQLPVEEDCASMLKDALKIFAESPLQQYEISAFAKEGYHSRHNTGYWMARPFFGLGPSAFSFYEGARFQNIPHLNRYYKTLKENNKPVDFEEKLNGVEALKELFLVELRLLQGVDIFFFEERHGKLGIEFLRSLEKANTDLLFFDGSVARLKEKGRLFYDSLASDLY